jgi:hypothetical protein
VSHIGYKAYRRPNARQERGVRGVRGEQRGVGNQETGLPVS